MHRLAALINATGGVYSEEQIKEAVLEVLETYTYFEDAYDTISEWNDGLEGDIQRKIVNELAKTVPTIMRKVLFCRACVYGIQNLFYQ